jgi:hypothetical protein
MDRVIERYFTWTGRFPLELVMTSTIGISYFWKLGIPASVILLCFSICRITTNKLGVVSFGVALILFATIPTDIINDSSWWVTGFYNYLLPVSLAVYAFSFSYILGNRKHEQMLCIVAALYFSYMEQAGIVYIISMLSLILLKKQARTKFNITILTLAFVNLIICLKAPGNEMRFTLETWTWYPQYQTYGIINKLSLGLDKLHQLMTYRYNGPLIFLSTLVIFLGASGGKLKNSVKVAILLMITFLSISIVNSLTGFFIGRSFFFNTTLDASKWSSSKIYLSYLYLLIIISAMFLILLDATIKGTINAVPIIAILLGYMSVTMMGMSPTVYASGLRVDFVFEITCIISAMYILNKKTI